MNKILIDTNVLIYALNISSAYHKDAIRILENPEYQLFISTKNITEYFAVCSKLSIEENKTFAFYDELLQNATILFPNPISIQNFQILLKKYKAKGNRVYDIEIVSTMLSYGLNKIATFNVGDFKSIEEIEII